MVPWTQRVWLGWRQNLAFYERRYEVLRVLDEQGVLRRFRERNEWLSVRLNSVYQVLSFGPTGMRLALLVPDADDALVKDAARTVWSMLEPAPAARIEVGFQWLLRIDASYEAARRQAASSLLGPNAETAYDDFALLLDGHHDQPTAQYRVELGVVDAIEAPARLARSSGRVGRDEPDIPSELWPPANLPEVALFCDADWMCRDSAVTSVEDLWELLDAVREAAETLMSTLTNRLELDLEP